MVDENGRIYCFLVLGKVCVVLLRLVIILRFEFIVVIVLVRVVSVLKEELDYEEF